LLMCSAGF